MLRFVDGDLVKNKEYRIFCQQVNCKKVMGAGIAKQIREEYPEVYERYMKKEPKLGAIQTIHCKDKRYCVNMYSQDDYGTKGRYTNYAAFQSCLETLEKKLKISDKSLKIAFPFNIGCGLGGGDWTIILMMLMQFAENVQQDVYIVRKAQK